MKIGHSVTGRLASVPEPRAGAKDSAESAPAGGQDGAQAGGNAVNLSALSRTLSAMENKLADGAVDSQRVASIKAAIQNGEFKVDAGAVADGLVKSVQDMLVKRG